MNPYHTFSELNFSWVNARPDQVSAVVLKCYNRPAASSLMDENGQPIPDFFLTQEATLSLPYFDVPVVSAPHKMVFWEPQNCRGTTVCMDATPGGPIELARESPFRWIGCVIAERPPFPGCTFDDVQGEIRRGLAAIKESGGWVFHSWGPVQPYEDTAYYTRRLIKDRLNRQVITDYLQRLGADISDERFWQTDEPVFVVRKKERPKMSQEEWDKHYAAGIRRQYEEEDRLYKERQQQAASSPTSEQVRTEGSLPGSPPLRVTTLEEFFRRGNAQIACNLGDKHPGNASFFSVLKSIRCCPDVQGVFVELSEGDFLDPDAKFSSERVYVVTTMKADELLELLRGIRPDEVVETPLDRLPGTSEQLKKGYAVFGVWWD
jgi:hypothetical protein